MKKMTKEDIKQYLLKVFKEEIPDEELYNLNEYIKQLTNVLVDELYDIAKDKIETLDEKQTFIIRKLFGILDNGNCQTYESVGKILKLSRQRIYEIKTKIIYYLTYQIIFGNGLSINNIKNQKVLLSDSIIILNLSVNDLKFFQSIGLKTINDLISINEILLSQKVNNDEKFKILKEKIIDLGFSFNKGLEEKFNNLPVTILNLSNRSLNTLKRAHIITISDLTKLTNLELSEINCLGKEGLEEIKRSLYNFIFIFNEMSSRETCNATVDVLNLSDGCKNALQQENIKTIDDLTKITKLKLCRFNGIGKNDLENIEACLQSLGLSFKEESFSEISKKIKKLPIEVLHLSTRALNVLEKENITTINDLIKMTKLELSKKDEVGTKIVEEIEICLQSIGLSFREESFSEIPENLKKCQ